MDLSECKKAFGQKSAGQQAADARAGVPKVLAVVLFMGRHRDKANKRSDCLVPKGALPNAGWYPVLALGTEKQH